MTNSTCFSFLDLISNFIMGGISSINNFFINDNQFKTPYKSKYYYLALVNDNNKGWSIHGLWPQYTKNTYPSYCRDVSFDYSALDPILSDLKQHWYSAKGSDESFWCHEWKKHGSCMFNTCDELEYFRKALELYVTVVEANVIDKYRVSNNKAMIPFDLNFKIIDNL